MKVLNLKTLIIVTILSLLAAQITQAAYARDGVCLRVPMKYGKNVRQNPEWRELDKEIRGLERAFRRLKKERQYLSREDYIKSLGISVTLGLSQSLIAYDFLLKKIASLMKDGRQQLFIYPAPGADRIIERHGEVFYITNSEAHLETGKLLLKTVFNNGSSSVMRRDEQPLLDALDFVSYDLASFEYPDRQLILIAKGLWFWPIDKRNREELEIELSNTLRDVAMNVLKDGDYILALTLDDVNMLAGIGLIPISLDYPDIEDFSFLVGRGEGGSAVFELPNAVGIFQKRSGVLVPVYCEVVDMNKEDITEIRIQNRDVRVSN